MVCVAVRGEPIIGIIHNPFTHQTIWAWKDVALSKPLQKIAEERVSPMAAVKNPKIIVSRSHTGDIKEYVKSVFGASTPVITAAGAGYKVLQVVFNNATAYMHKTRIKKWDLCAGHAILSALGGKMTTLEDRPIGYNAHDSEVNDDGVLATLRHHNYYSNLIHNFETQLKMFKASNYA